MNFLKKWNRERKREERAFNLHSLLENVEMTKGNYIYLRNILEGEVK